MIRPRIPILCGAMGPAAGELKARTRLRAFDPGLAYVLTLRELMKYPRGQLVVDLTHIGPPNVRSVRLKEAAQQRGLRLATVHHLARLPAYQPGTG